MTSVTIAEGVTEIGSSAFYGATALISIDFSHATSLKTIGMSAFYEATALTSVTLPEGLETIDNYAFYKATALTSVTLPEGLETIDNYAFQDATALTSVTIPSSVKTIGEEAFGDSGLTSASVPVCTDIGTSAFPSTTTVSKYLARGCLDQFTHAHTYAQMASFLTTEELKAAYSSATGNPIDIDLSQFSLEELKAAYRATGACPN